MATFRILEITLLLLVALATSYGHGSRHEGHTHHMPNRDGSGNVLKDKDFIRDYEHIKEDVQDLYNKDFAENLGDQDMEAYFFQLHDLDQDGRLDGLELLSAFHHVRTQYEEEIPDDYFKDAKSASKDVQDYWNERFEEDAAMIDDIMREEDVDQDGYLSYFEFVLGRQREEGRV